MTASTTTINFRATTDFRDLIDRAATAQGKTRTDFIMAASEAEAQRVLLDRAFFQLDEAQMQAFQAVLDQPIDQNAAVNRLLAKKAPWDQ
ncbi:DUF1778 domain-containing protein [Roseateles amylovorans]|uniref:DUF1778 domain-containing protein n=1 Tax=Roseateles amylovorans TaxID=2978473 RepID=A0ABY6B6X2_9BURK|nr:DUF1778 domain-containing protein [Roseateles amylovorans]UXH80582.1 DUF1778 domain-containing protein [Roseateles amylovorans]